MASSLGDAATDIRRMVEVESDSFTLTRELTSLLESVAEAIGPLFARGCIVQCSLSEHPDPQSSVCLYQLAREALMNAARHSDASTVVLTLVAEADAYVLTIVDDGKGFPDGVLADDGTLKGFGLPAMRARVEQIGGTITFGTPVEGGAVVTASFPAATGREFA